MKVDYSKTFIYKLCCRDPTITDIYVGHSTDFKSRNKKHKEYSNNINHKKSNSYNYRFIRENGGYENWIMIKLYDYPCNSKREAEKQECKTMIELNATLNTYKPFRTEEEKKEYEKQYRQDNQIKIIEYSKKNRKSILEQQKEYRQNNKTEISERKKIKVKCQFCNCEVRKDGIIKHQKSLKCMKFRDFIDLE